MLIIIRFYEYSQKEKIFSIPIPDNSFVNPNKNLDITITAVQFQSRTVVGGKPKVSAKTNEIRVTIKDDDGKV